jgi:hypothetical protein
MKKPFVLFLLILSSYSFAQSQPDLEQFFEGRKVTIKLDMPATKYGIDIWPERRPPLNFDDYAKRLKQFGTSIREGETYVITKVKLKKDLIEVQLGGGGFGTAGDDSSTYVSRPSPNKTQREKDLERDLKTVSDSAQKQRMKRELDDLRQDRAYQESQMRAVAEQAEEFKKSRVREQAKTAGSRFNLRYAKLLPSYAMTPEAIMQALAPYVDFGLQSSGARATPANSDPATMPRLHKGMTNEEVEQVLGYPNSQSDRQEGKLTVNTWSYKKGSRSIDAEFVNDILIKYSIREQ